MEAGSDPIATLRRNAARRFGYFLGEFSMHALATIANEGATPVVAPPTLAVAPTTRAQTLYENFANPLEGQGKVKVILNMLDATSVEFDAYLKQAVIIAAHADHAAGWTAAPAAKGADKYGPKQKSMHVQVSNIRKVFGACKQFGTLWDVNDLHYDVESLGITTATKLAGKILRLAGVDWQGRKALTDDQKATNAKSAQWVAALAAAQANPACAGKSIAEILASDAMEAEVRRLEALDVSAQADKLTRSWTANENARVVVLAAVRFIAAMATDEERTSAIDAISASY